MSEFYKVQTEGFQKLNGCIARSKVIKCHVKSVLCIFSAHNKTVKSKHLILLGAENM